MILDEVRLLVRDYAAPLCFKSGFCSPKPRKSGDRRRVMGDWWEHHEGGREKRSEVSEVAGRVERKLPSGHQENGDAGTQCYFP